MIEYARKQRLVEPLEAVRIRDALRLTGGSTEERLATIIDAKATELLAAPLYAGTVSVRIDRQEEECLREVLARWVADGSVSEGETQRLWGLWSDLKGIPGGS